MKITEFKNEAYDLLRNKYAHLSDKKIKNIINNYVEVVTDEVWRNWLTLNVFGNLAFVRKEWIRRNSGRLCLKKGSKKQTYIDNWFNKNLPLYKILEKGQKLQNNEGKLTQIHLPYKLEVNGRTFNEMVDLINDVEKELNLTETEKTNLLKVNYGNSYEEYENYKNDKTIGDVVKVDLHGLRKYIEDKKNEKKKNKSRTEAEFVGGLNERIKEAVRIYRTAELCDGELVQVINESEFGRKYYKGVNLQSIHKDIRSAALGKCYEYDFENSVYAWRLSKAKSIDKTTQWHATQEYINNKNAIRERLADVVYGKAEGEEKEENIKNIKQVFTAISFGARGSKKDIYYTSSEGTLKKQAINTILRDEKQRERFFGDVFVVKFIDEQKKISKLILDEEADNFKGVDIVKTAKGNISHNKVLAYCYQQNEREIMDACVKHIKKKDLLLLVHDAFYVNENDLSKTAYNNIMRTLRKFNKELKLERTAYLN